MNTVLKIILSILVIVWLVIMYQTKFGQESLAKKTPNLLVVGVAQQDMPFSGSVAQALAKRIGKKVLVKEIAEDTLIAKLLNNTVQAAVQKSDTPHEDLLFSEPYNQGENLYYFAVTKNNNALLILINNALVEIKEDGTLTELQNVKM